MYNNQKKIYDILCKTKSKGSSGIIHAIMRSGKTLPTLKYIEDSYTERHNVLWIAENTNERDTELLAEVNKFNVQLKCNFSITLIESLHHYKNKFYDCIVYNECHSITENVRDNLLAMKPGRLIGLTGTYPNNTQKQKYLGDVGLNNFLIVYNIKTAINDKRVSDYKVTLIKIPLDRVTKDVKVEYKKNGKIESFYTTEYERYRYIQDQIDIIDRKIAPLKAKQLRVQKQIEQFGEYVDETEDNKEFLRGLYSVYRNYADELKPLYNQKSTPSIRLSIILNTLPSKALLAKQIIKKNSGKRLLIFAQNSDMSEKITNFIYNSKTEKTHFDQFQNQEINHLCLVNKGSTGTTYTQVDGCLSTIVNKSNRLLQKVGRSLLFAPGKVSNIMFLVSKNTIQEDWIKEAISELDPSKIKEIDLSLNVLKNEILNE